MKLKTWKFAFIITLLLLVGSNLFWFMVVIDQAVTDKYQSMNIYHQEQVIREMGQLIVSGSKDYNKKDILHLLRQANKEAFITEEENTIIYENVYFTFENDKLVKVQ
ncbi:MAG: Imm58 family immunity protein [Neptuniibacter sp.]